MSSSGLIYLAILAAWAVYLASRCLRTPAHQPEALAPADGAVLRRRGRRDRYAAVDAEPEVAVTEPVTPTVKSRRADLGHGGGRPPGAVEAAAAAAAAGRPVRDVPPVRVSRATARRRRRMLGLFLLAAAVLAGCWWFALVPLWTPVVPVLLGATYLAEIRAGTRRARARLEQVVAPVPLPVEAAAGQVRRAPRTAVRTEGGESEFVDLWPVYDKPADRMKGQAWQPVPLPLPTYVTAPTAAEARAAAAAAEGKAAFTGRRIDISPGKSWVTSPTEDTQELPVIRVVPSEAETVDEQPVEAAEAGAGTPAVDLTSKRAVNG